MTQDSRRRARNPLLVNFSWAMALAVVVLAGYVGSYPLVARCSDAPEIAVYRPVEYLIDKTPLKTEMFWWAGKCGGEAENGVLRASLRRRLAEKQRRRQVETWPVDEW